MESTQKKSFVTVVITVFVMLAILRGLGLSEFMEPAHVRIVVCCLISVGIVFAVAFIPNFKKYSTQSPREDLDQNREPEADSQHHDETSPTENTSIPSSSPNHSCTEQTPLISDTTHNSTSHGSSEQNIQPQSTIHSPAPNNPILTDASSNGAQTWTVHIGQRDSQSLTHLLSKYSLAMAVFIFGGGIIVLYMYKIFYNAQCLQFFEKSDTPNANDEYDAYGYYDELSRLVSAALKIIFIGIEIPLLHYLSSVRSLRSKTISQYFLLPIMGANVTMFLYIFLDETHLIPLYNYHYPSEAFVYNISTACQTHSSITEIYMRTSMYKMFYPISMEFCIASVEILLLVYNAPILGSETKEASVFSTQEVDDMRRAIQSFIDEKRKVQPVALHDQEETSTNCPNAEGLSGSGNEVNPTTDRSIKIPILVAKENGDHPNETKCKRFKKCCMIIFHPFTALVLGVVEASLMQIALLHEDVAPHYINQHYFFFWYKIPMMFVLIFNAILLLIATIFCVWVICSFKNERKPRQVHVLGLLFGVLSIICISLYRIVVPILKMTKKSLEGFSVAEQILMCSLSTIESITFMLQYLLQAWLIWTGHKKIAEPGHQWYKSLQRCLSFLAMSNFIHWGINSFLEGDYLKHRVDLIVDGKTWDIMVHLFIPACIYFRYISTFLLLEVKHMLKKEEVQIDEWQLSLNALEDEQKQA